MKWINIVAVTAVVIVALAMVVETIFLVKTVGDQQMLMAQVSNGEQKLKDSKVENEKLTQDLSVAVQAKEDLAKKSATLEQEKEKLTTENKKISQELEDKSAKVLLLNQEYNSLNDKFMCSKTIKDVDFSTNNSVNKSLKEFVNDDKNLKESISASYWNTIWTGEKYSIHTIEVESKKDNINYIWKFTVYFRGEAHGDHLDGIFYNDYQCWLYLDK